MKTKISIFAFLLFACSGCADYDDLILEGEQLSESGQTAEAIDAFNSALAKDTARLEAYYGIAVAYAKNCREKHVDCQKGVDYFSQVLVRDSSYKRALYSRAKCYMEMKQYHTAIDDFDNDICNAAISAEYFEKRMICYLELGDTIKASKCYVPMYSFNMSLKTKALDELFKKSFDIIYDR